MVVVNVVLLITPQKVQGKLTNDKYRNPAALCCVLYPLCPQEGTALQVFINLILLNMLWLCKLDLTAQHPHVSAFFKGAQL